MRMGGDHHGDDGAYRQYTTDQDSTHVASHTGPRGMDVKPEGGVHTPAHADGGLETPDFTPQFTGRQCPNQWAMRLDVEDREDATKSTEVKCPDAPTTLDRWCNPHGAANTAEDQKTLFFKKGFSRHRH